MASTMAVGNYAHEIVALTQQYTAGVARLSSEKGIADASRSTHRWGRLPRTQRGAAGHRAQGGTRYGDTVSGSSTGGGASSNPTTKSSTIERMRGTLPAAARASGPRGSPRTWSTTGCERGKTIAELGLDALIVIGGEGTLSCGLADLARWGARHRRRPQDDRQRHRSHRADVRFRHRGAIATDAIDRLHTTAESHDRVMVVEVMGRHVGHIATWAGIAGGATMTLIPEEPFDIDAVADALRVDTSAASTHPSWWSPRGLPVRARSTLPSRGRPVRPQAPWRHRERRGSRDRAPDRVRDPRDGPWTRSTRRNAHSVRSGAVYVVRRRRDRRSPRR